MFSTRTSRTWFSFVTPVFQPAQLADWKVGVTGSRFNDGIAGGPSVHLRVWKKEVIKIGNAPGSGAVFRALAENLVGAYGL